MSRTTILFVTYLTWSSHFNSISSIFPFEIITRLRWKCNFETLCQTGFCVFLVWSSVEHFESLPAMRALNLTPRKHIGGLVQQVGSPDMVVVFTLPLMYASICHVLSPNTRRDQGPWCSRGPESSGDSVRPALLAVCWKKSSFSGPTPPPHVVFGSQGPWGHSTCD